MSRVKHRQRAGFTLLEVITSTFIAAAVIVPAMVAMRRSMQMSRGVTTTNSLTTLCVGKMEQELVAAAAEFQNSTHSGAFTEYNDANLRYNVQRTDQAAKGGRPGELMSVLVTVYEDRNDNQKLDPLERRVSMSSKVAKLASYQTEAKKGNGKGKGKG